MSRTALITGITGQDGSYLAELLVNRGYQVHGLARRIDAANSWRLASVRDRISLHAGDLRDQERLTELVGQIQPHEVYNLAAQTFVPESWNDPAGTSDITALGAVRLLEAVRAVDPEIRICQAGSSEVFGNPEECPQRESTPMRARSPYGAAKIYARHLVMLARERHEMFACTAILFNHESARRGSGFVTQKIVEGAVRIAAGTQSELRLGSLDAVRDWGHAKDYVRAMHLMLQQERADDYVIGTGVPRTVRDFAISTFRQLGLDAEKHIVVDPAFVRPAEPFPPVADPSHARQELGWEPEVSFDDLTREMVAAEKTRFEQQAQTASAA